ncbi:MAG: hypothetical protein AB1715_01490 [Acidobacteriota bacterium]
MSNYGFSGENKKFKPGLHLKLTGGRFYAAVGDMNTRLGSFNNYYRRSYEESLSGEIRTINPWWNHWQLELLFDFSQRFRLGIGTVSSSLGRNQSAVSYTPASIFYIIDHQVILIPEIRVKTPLQLSLYYSFLSSSRFDISVYAGTGLYSARMREEIIENAIYPDGDVYYNKRSWSVENKSFFIFHAGISAEIDLLRNLALVAELQGRYGKLSKLRGTVRYETNYGTGLTIVESGILHFFGFPDSYYDLDIPLPYRIGPLPDQYIERNAFLDLSGFSFRIGIKVRLF